MRASLMIPCALSLALVVRAGHTAPKCGSVAITTELEETFETGGDGLIDPGEFVAFGFNYTNWNCFAAGDVTGTLSLAPPPVAGVALLRDRPSLAYLEHHDCVETDPSEALLCIEADVPCGTPLELDLAGEGIWLGMPGTVGFRGRVRRYVGEDYGRPVAGGKSIRAAKLEGGYGLLDPESPDGLTYTRLDASGAPVSAPTRLTTHGIATGFALSADGDGAAITWFERASHGALYRSLVVARVDADGGLVLAPTPIAAGEWWFSDGVTNALVSTPGGFLAAWSSDVGFEVLAFSSDGLVLGPQTTLPFSIGPGTRRGAVLQFARTDDGLVLAWNEGSAPARLSRVVLQQLDELGGAIGPPVVVDEAPLTGSTNGVSLRSATGSPESVAILSQQWVAYAVELVSFQLRAADGTLVAPLVELADGYAVSWGGSDWLVFRSVATYRDPFGPVTTQRIAARAESLGPLETFLPITLDARLAAVSWDGAVASAVYVQSAAGHASGPLEIRFKRSDWPLFDCEPGPVTSCSSEIEAGAPTAVIRPAVVSACTGDAIRLEDASVGAGIYGRAWDVDDDGDVDATSRAIVVTRTEAGVTPVTLEVLGLGGRAAANATLYFASARGGSVDGLLLTRSGAGIVATVRESHGATSFRVWASSRRDLAESRPIADGELGPTFDVGSPAFVTIESLLPCLSSEGD